MAQDSKVIANVLDWITHPLYSDEPVGYWLAGLVGILILSFLWSTVVRQLDV